MDQPDSTKERHHTSSRVSYTFTVIMKKNELFHLNLRFACLFFQTLHLRPSPQSMYWMQQHELLKTFWCVGRPACSPHKVKSGERPGSATQFICSSSLSPLQVKERKFTQNLWYTSTYTYVHAIFLFSVFEVFFVIWHQSEKSEMEDEFSLYKYYQLLALASYFFPNIACRILFLHILSEPGFKSFRVTFRPDGKQDVYLR